MDISEIKRRLARPATRLTAGGFRPTGQEDESWIGKVFLYGPDEAVPLDAEGEEMLPLAQLYLPALPHRPAVLHDTRILAVFISRTFPEPMEEMGSHWVVREYGRDDRLEHRAGPSPDSFLKPFPLKAALVEADFPLWDGGGVPRDLEEEILRLEDAGEIESYYDLVSHVHEHKLGGYPSFCQSGVDPGDGFEFAFQISSDPKVGLNVVDSGSLMFWKHAHTGRWALYYDFH
jgi:hypothetical protein